MVCGVKFKDNGKMYYFSSNDIDVKVDMKVIVDTEKGEQLGKVSEIDIDKKKTIDTSKLKNVIRIASDKDYDIYLNNLKDATKALEFVREKVKELNIDMRIVDALYTLDKKQLTFNFVADDRVDFRDLVKVIAAKYKSRIELHQMGLRDKAKEVGGLGPCGRPLCCLSHQVSESISINMAKNQNIALNPTKINGLCGRLMCCLSYEDETYSLCRKKLPKMGEVLETEKGRGKVVALDILKGKYTVEINGERYEFDK